MPKTTDATRTQQLVEEIGEYSLHLMWILRQEAVRTFDPFGFRPVRALLLELVGRGYNHPKELAEILDQVPPAISTMIADLEDRGLLTRRTDPHDRRRVQLELTEAGAETHRRLKEAWQQTGCKRLSKLSNEELETLVHIYRKLLEDA